MPVHLGTSDWEDERNRKAPVCPECGSPMRIKAGPLGEFYGCSRFPDCKGKKMIDDKVPNFEPNNDTDHDYISQMIKELYG